MVNHFSSVCRFRVPTFGDPVSQLIWLKNPGTAPPTPGQAWDWQWFLASEGPDVYFEEEVFQVKYSIQLLQ